MVVTYTDSIYFIWCTGRTQAVCKYWHLYNEFNIPETAWSDCWPPVVNSYLKTTTLCKAYMFSIMLEVNNGWMCISCTENRVHHPEYQLCTRHDAPLTQNLVFQSCTILYTIACCSNIDKNTAHVSHLPAERAMCVCIFAMYAQA